MPSCRHCRVKKVCRPRGLCWCCYKDPAVSALYPSASKYAGLRDPTQAELDALITEQMASLPPWWDKESRKAAAGLDA